MKTHYTELELELYRIAGMEPPTPISAQERAEHNRWVKAWEVACKEVEARAKAAAKEEARRDAAALIANKEALRKAKKMRANLDKARVARERNAKRRKKAHQAVLKTFKLL